VPVFVIEDLTTIKRPDFRTLRKNASDTNVWFVPNFYSGIHNTGSELSEDPNQPNLPNQPNSTEDLRRDTSIRHRRPVNNEASDNGIQRGALRSSLPNSGVWELVEHPRGSLPNLSVRELAEHPRSLLGSKLPSPSVRELAEHPNFPNSLTAGDESASEFPNSMRSNDLQRGATEPKRLQGLERPNSGLNSEEPEDLMEVSESYYPARPSEEYHPTREERRQVQGRSMVRFDEIEQLTDPVQ